VRELTTRRAEMTARLVKLRKSKETLERMRREARQAHTRRQWKLEQKQFDQTAQIAFVRGIQRGRRRPGRTGALER